MNSLITQLYWREPLWLLLATFPLFLMLWRMIKQRHSLRQYADASLLPWVTIPHHKSYGWQQTFYQFLIWLLFGMAAAGPRLLVSAPENFLPPKGAAVIIVDHSRSMLADDLTPNRRQQANDIVVQWMKETQPLKLGLIVFAGAPHVVLPPTSDKPALQQTELLLEEIQLPTHGSALPEALQQAQLLLRDESGSRAIIVLTDGDLPDAAFAQLRKLATELDQEKVTLHLLGVGTPSQIALSDGKGRWLLQDGQAVTTRLNETALQTLAENPGAHYSRLNSEAHQRLQNVWKPESARIATKHQDQVLWQELFPWCLVPALLLMLLNYLKIPRLVLPFVYMVAIVFLVQPQQSQAEEGNALQLAYHAWQNKNYAIAAKFYSGLNGYAARMGEGASCFRDQQVECAISAFSRAAWLAKNDQQRGQAAFNLGNSFFRQGDFKSAITLYQDALRYQPQQASYQHNLSFSEEVQTQIELRLRQEADSQAGKRQGGKIVNVDDGTFVTPDMQLTLDDKFEDKSLAKHQPVQLSEEQLAEYMQRSQTYASLASNQGSVTPAQHNWRRFSNENPAAAHQIEFWQRLFELEEDVQVHPDTPKILPGVQPW